VTGADQYPDLEIATLDVGKEGDPTDERVAGWVQGLQRGFQHPRPNDDFRAAWLEHVRADRVTSRGAWLREARIGSRAIPVATYASWDKTLNTGGGLLPLRMITDITVSPTHRRRGLLRRLITDDLQDAVDHGVPLAALTVSEGSIYGRFGFGQATHVRHVEVDTARFALRDPIAGATAPGRIEQAEPDEAWKSVQTVFDGFHRTTRGSVERPEFYRQILSGAFDFQEQGPDRKLRAGVHLDDDGEPDGHVLYRHDRSTEIRAIDVVDLVALTAEVYLRLWRYLAEFDLVHRVRWSQAPTHDPLEWALVEPHARKVTKIDDFLWVRVLDVPTALAARPWGTDGSVVLEVDDPQGHAAGRWRVQVQDGRASVSRTDATSDARLTAETLGSLYLGGVTVPALSAGGRLAGDADAMATLAAMADAGPTPYCITGF